jgi:hypothetical protein
VGRTSRPAAYSADVTIQPIVYLAELVFQFSVNRMFQVLPVARTVSIAVTCWGEGETGGKAVLLTGRAHRPESSRKWCPDRLKALQVKSLQ